MLQAVTRRGLTGRLVLLLALALLLVGAAIGLGRAPGAPAANADCACALERLRNGWCAACGKGYVAGFEIRSRVLFDALDAHGHTLDPAVMSCATCKTLNRSGGFCEACRFGWLDGQAYMSRLTYHLAKGVTRDPSTLACSTCRELAGGSGWCASCAGGWAGIQYFAERGDFEDAARELVRLRGAIGVSARCETCALVLLVDGRCPYCDITYSGGVAQTKKEGG